MIRFVTIQAIWILMILSAVSSVRMLYPDWTMTSNMISVILYFTLTGLISAAVTDIVDRWFFGKVSAPKLKTQTKITRAHPLSAQGAT